MTDKPMKQQIETIQAMCKKYEKLTKTLEVITNKCASVNIALDTWAGYKINEVFDMQDMSDSVKILAEQKIREELHIVGIVLDRMAGCCDGY